MGTKNLLDTIRKTNESAQQMTRIAILISALSESRDPGKRHILMYGLVAILANTMRYVSSDGNGQEAPALLAGACSCAAGACGEG